MTLKELTAKIEEKTATKKDLFEFYQIKNEEVLLFALEEKMKDVKQNSDLLNTSFTFIYEARKKKEFNPLEELYFFYAVLVKALYNIDSDEVRAMSSLLGTFKTIMMLDELLENKKEVIFFKKMYKNYVERTESVYVKLNDFMAALTKVIEDFSPEKLEKITKELSEKFAQLKE
jgi:hypothetical protein